MAGCLQRLSELIAAEHVYCADCDCKDMDMLIMGSHLEVSCQKCHVPMNIYAGNKADLHLLQKVEEIFIDGGRSKVRFADAPPQLPSIEISDSPGIPEDNSDPTGNGPLN